MSGLSLFFDFIAPITTGVELAFRPTEAIKIEQINIHADEAFGDRNLICTCAPIEDYIES